MSRKFFVGWETWEKLVFCLLCAIIVTLLIGCVKLISTHRRLRKLTREAAEDKRELASLQQMMEQGQSNSQNQSDKTPFGIRAIESGIEVDGVWISRSNTPDLESRRPSTILTTKDLLPRTDSEISVEQPKSSHHHATIHHAAGRLSMRLASSANDRNTRADQMQASSGSNNRGSVTAIANPAQNQSQPSEYMHYKDQPHLLHTSSAAAALAGLDSIHRACTSVSIHDYPHHIDSSPYSSGGTAEVESIAASAPSLLGVRDETATKQMASDLDDLLTSHRMSLAAETGHLTPRRRKTVRSQSDDWSHLSRPAQASALRLRLGELDTTQTQANASDTELALYSVPPSPSSSTSTLPAARRSSMPNVMPFAQFCQTAPPSSVLDGSQRRFSEAWSVSSKPQGAEQESDCSAGASPTTPTSSDSHDSADQVSFRRLSFENRNPYILRGHGTGFEVLAPGTFKLPKAQDSARDWERRAPPISLHKFNSRHRSSSTDRRNKLRKKRSPSAGSQASSEGSSTSIPSTRNRDV